MDEDYVELMEEKDPAEDEERTPVPHEKRFWESRGRELDSRSFYAMFYCTRPTFCKLVKELYGTTAYFEGDGEGSPAFDPCEHVAVFMNRIGTGNGLVLTSVMFDVSEHDVFEITKSVARRVMDSLAEEYVAWPDADEQAEISENWETENPLRKVIGVIDASHIKIPPPPKNLRSQYRNFKQFYSVILLAVVDNNGSFRWLSAGSPGSRRDNALFRKTPLFEDIEEEDQALPLSERFYLADGACLLGDSAFAESSWVRTPIPSASTRRECFFNHKHAKQRSGAGHAFGRLKKKFQCLEVGTLFNRKNAELITSACVVLYNFILSLEGYSLDEAWDAGECGEGNGLAGEQVDLDQTKNGTAQRRQPGEGVGGERSARQVEVDYLADSGFIEKEWGASSPGSNS